MIAPDSESNVPINDITLEPLTKQPGSRDGHHRVELNRSNVAGFTIGPPVFTRRKHTAAGSQHIVAGSCRADLLQRQQASPK